MRRTAVNLDIRVARSTDATLSSQRRYQRRTSSGSSRSGMRWHPASDMRELERTQQRPRINGVCTASSRRRIAPCRSRFRSSIDPRANSQPRSQRETSSPPALAPLFARRPTALREGGEAGRLRAPQRGDHAEAHEMWIIDNAGTGARACSNCIDEMPFGSVE